MVIVDQQRAHQRVLYEQFWLIWLFSRHQVSNCYFRWFVFSNRNGAYRRVETCSGEYRFCFLKTLVRIMLSFLVPRKCNWEWGFFSVRTITEWFARRNSRQ
jgi:hypothetical protein